MEAENIRGRKIVVAIDESEESMYALTWCLNNIIATSDQNSETTNLVLLYVKPPPPAYSAFDLAGLFFGNDVVGSLEDYSKRLVDSVMSRAETICKKSKINVEVEKKVGSGDAKEVICGAVDKLGADMLVMGSHGYGFLKRTLLGSVSYDCAKRVKCPMVVVKHPKNCS